MSKTLGDPDCKGAIFVYKDDDSVDEAWESVIKVNRDHGGIRGELHEKPSDFLAALLKWNNSVGGENAYLCIYAHMGTTGMCSKPRSPADISWPELANSLPKKIELLWLMGCKSAECLKTWNGLTAPVDYGILATSKSCYWAPFIDEFSKEISLKKVRTYDQMPFELSKSQPDLAKYIDYYRVAEDGLSFHAGFC